MRMYVRVSQSAWSWAGWHYIELLMARRYSLDCPFPDRREILRVPHLYFSTSPLSLVAYYAYVPDRISAKDRRIAFYLD